MGRTPHQTGSMGLHYVCYRLAGQGWHVDTGRRGAASSTEGKCWRKKEHPITFQTNSFSETAAVPFTRRGFYGVTKDFLVIATKLNSGSPQCYILTRDESQKVMTQDGKGDWWIEIEDYDTEEFKERWDKLETYSAMSR